MKNIMVAAAVLALATPAMASKARLQALSESPHLTDNRSGLTNPALMGADHVVFEMGAAHTAMSNAAGAATAEGGFVKTHGAGKWQVYLGNDNDLSVRDATTFTTNVNPVDIGYATKAGDMEWGLGLSYSNSDKKTAVAVKQSSTTLKAGVVTGPWDAHLNLLLADTADTATQKFKGSTGANLFGGYTMESNYFYGEYKMTGGKIEPVGGGAATNDQENSTITLGYVNSMKSEGVELFYGVAYNMTTNKEKAADSKTETTTLPFTIGLEADATSWMVLRGSVSQNVLLGSTKTTTGGTGDADTTANNTTVAAGLGFKWGKTTLDATLKAATTGTIGTDGNNFLGNAGLTHTF
jgi:hypothetical protein